MTSNRFFTSAFIFFCVINIGLFKELPSRGVFLHWDEHRAVVDPGQGWVTLTKKFVHRRFIKPHASYIHACKRDPNTIEDCVLKSIESLKPQLLSGIPEIDVPSIEPFFIPEITVLNTNNVPLRASGYNVKVTGTADFKIKSLSVNLDTLVIKGRVRFPKLHFEGDYTLDTQILVVPLRGKGKLDADAIKCDAELVLHTQIFKRDGIEYIKFTKLETDINVKDYRVKLDGLFNGDKTLGEAANAAINQNRGEFLKATKPHLEKTASKFLLDIANKVVDGLSLDQLFPKP